MNHWQRVMPLIIALAVTFLPLIAAACPTCKDNLAHDPASASLVRGYAYSIVFMLSMPPLILGGLTAYFYWEVRRAKARDAAAAYDVSPSRGSYH